LVLGGLEERVDRDFVALIEHLQNDALEEEAGHVEAWVGVDFYEVEVHIVIKHVVKPHQLEPIIITTRILSFVD